MGFYLLLVFVEDAARDPGVYDRVYDLFAKRSNSSGPDDAVDAVLKPIEDTWMQKTEKHKRGSDADGGNRLAGMMDHLSEGIADNMPVEIKRLVALLQVFHGIVLSFPFEMAAALGTRKHAARLNRCTQATSVPLDLRMVLIALAARWCVVLAEAPRSSKSMAYIVDSFYQSFGKLPDLQFLPKAPSVTRTQEGWRYPPPYCHPNDIDFMYMPAPVHEQMLAQKHELLRIASHHTSPVSRHQLLAHHPYDYRDLASHLSQASLSQPPRQPQGRPRGEEDEDEVVTPELLDRMESRSLELTSLSSMLVDNLVSLPADENPNENDVIRDILHELNRLYEIVSNYINVLSPEHTISLRRLRAAIEESRRAQWLYRDAVNAFDDPTRLDDDAGVKTKSSLVKHLLTVNTGTERGGAMDAGSAASSSLRLPNTNKTNNHNEINSPAIAPTVSDSAYPQDTVGSATNSARPPVPKSGSSVYLSQTTSQNPPAIADSQAECSKTAATRAAAIAGAPPSSLPSDGVRQTPLFHGNATAPTVADIASFPPLPPTLQRVSTKVRGKMPDLGDVRG
ncbi:hypothetical protein GGH99_000992 [Coemansia sp. RSA 1285]|nr:hypothetical protein GGH99_000992 [Coemansia sp. RSA 1285]